MSARAFAALGAALVVVLLTVFLVGFGEPSPWSVLASVFYGWLILWLWPWCPPDSEADHEKD